MSQTNVVKCANPACTALVLASRKFCSRHKPATKPAEIVGTIDPKQFARTLAQTRQERTRQNNLAVAEQNRASALQAAAFMAVKPFAPVAAKVATELRQEFAKAEPIVATGRSHGKFVSKATYAEAQVTAMKLAMLGYGE
jgi:hypothetical protein